MRNLIFVFILILFASCSMNNKYEGNWTSPNSYLFLHEDEIFDAILEGEYYTGKWNTDKGNILSLQTYANKIMVFKIEEEDSKRLKLKSMDSDKKYSFTKEKTASVDDELRYWKESENWWRVPPKQYENSQQICDRTKAAMKSAICYLEYRKQQPHPTFRMTALTLPVYLARNGVRLEKETGEAWKSCFFSEENAEQGHKILKYAFDQDFGIDESLLEVDLSISILNDLYSFMDVAKVEFEQLRKLNLSDYNSTQYTEWKQKPLRPEMDEEIKNRIRNCVEYSIAYIYTEGLKHAYTPFDKLPLPLLFRGKGITLTKELPQQWVDMFYNAKEAQKGYDMLENALFSGFEIPKELNHEELNIFILQQVVIELNK